MKKTTRIIVSLLVLVMTLCLFAGCEEKPDETTAPAAPTEPSKPVELNLNVFYNKTHTKILALDKDDATYHITLYNKGISTTQRTKDEAVAQKMIDASFMLLVKDEGGLVTDVQAIEDFSGEFVAAGAYVKAVNGNKVTLSGATYGAGPDLGTIELDANCFITDVTGTSTTGAVMKLRENDQIYAIANAKGEIKNVFITARVAEQRIAHCEHCDADVVWTAHYPDKNAMPTAAGHWYIAGDMSAKASTSTATSDVVVDLNGKTVMTVAKVQFYILNNAKTSLYIMDSSAEQTGMIKAIKGDDGDNKLTAAGGVIDVGIAGAKFTLLSGTIDASGLYTNQTGAAVYVVKGASFDMKGGKIIGGTTIAWWNVDAEKGKEDTGGRGGALNLASGSTTTISGGEIVGGKSIAADSKTQRSQGGAIYLYKGASLTITGGKISGGEADHAGDCIYVEDKADLKIEGGTVAESDIEYKVTEPTA